MSKPYVSLQATKQGEVMNCVEIRKKLTAWVDDELPAGAADRIERHLEQCPSCQQEARGHRQLVTALNALPGFKAPPGFSRKAKKAFRAGLEMPSLAQWWRQLNPAMRGAFCGVALAGLLCGAVLAASLTTTLGAGDPATPYHTLYASNGMLP